MSNQAALPSTGRSWRLFSVLDRMIIAELLQTSAAVLAVLVTIIVSQKFIRVLAQAIEGNIANDTVASLLAYKIVIVTAAFLPAALFMAVLMVLGRMYRENEIAAIASAGGGLSTLYRALFLALLPLSLIAGGLSMFAAPWAEARTQQLTHQDGQSADVRSISAGRFSEYSHGELIFYAESVERTGEMHRVFVQNKEGETLGVTTAERGRLQYLPGGLYLILERGERILGQPGQRDFRIERFDQYAVLIEHKTTELILGSHAVDTERLLISNERLDIAELQDRLNGPAGLILLGFLAVPLARVSPRGGIYGSMLIAFGVYFAYSNLQRVNHSWVVAGKISPWLGYLSLNIGLLLLGVLLLIRLYGLKWCWLKLTSELRQ